MVVSVLPIQGIWERAQGKSLVGVAALLGINGHPRCRLFVRYAPIAAKLLQCRELTRCANKRHCTHGVAAEMETQKPQC